MKITLDLPDWTDERHLYIFAGVELVAFKYKDQNWQVKSSRCNMCGKCCENFSKDKKSKFFDIKKGVCTHLTQDGDKKICGLGLARPFSCSAGRGRERVPEIDCSECFEVVNVS